MRPKPPEHVSADLPVVSRFDNRIPGESRWHSHDGGQFILVEVGVSHLETDRGAWIIPTRRIGWIPAGVRHFSRPSAIGQGWVLLAPPSLSGRFPKAVCVLHGTPLLATALLRLTQYRGNQTTPAELLWQIVACEIAAARRETTAIPMPGAEPLRAVAQQFLHRPTIEDDVAELSARARMSRRSFTRHFHAQTGLTFSQWRRAVIAHHALVLLAAGSKVSAVAHDVGYESESAFIAMFHRVFGAPPSQYLGTSGGELL
jgi:AraC-like DNA-binding protein